MINVQKNKDCCKKKLKNAVKRFFKLDYLVVVK
jgi:hypothetical protein